MNPKRFLMACSSVLSIGAFLSVAHPRLVAWSEASNSNLIAEQRCATGDVMSHPIELGQLVKLNPGRPVCHWNGSTGVVSNDRTILWIKNGSPERIQSILKQRGYRQ
jgi:hypothetical protein